MSLRWLALCSCRRAAPCPGWHSCLSGCSPLSAPEVPSRFQISDHNVQRNWPQRLYHEWHHHAPCKQKGFQLLSGVWHLAICSARLAAAGRIVQVKLGQRVGRNLEIERIWPFSVYQVVFLPHPQWKSWWIRRLGIENGQPWAWVWLVDQLSSNVEEHSIDLLSIARSSSDQKIPALQICFFLLPNFQFLINLYQY